MKKFFRRLKRAFQVFKDDPTMFHETNELWGEDVLNWLKTSEVYVNDIFKNRANIIEFLATKMISFHSALGYIITTFHDGEVILNKEDVEKYAYKIRFENEKYVVRAVVETEEIPK